MSIVSSFVSEDRGDRCDSPDFPGSMRQSCWIHRSGPSDNLGSHVTRGTVDDDLVPVAKVECHPYVARQVYSVPPNGEDLHSLGVIYGSRGDLLRVQHLFSLTGGVKAIMLLVFECFRLSRIGRLSWPSGAARRRRPPGAIHDGRLHLSCRKMRVFHMGAFVVNGLRRRRTRAPLANLPATPRAEQVLYDGSNPP